MSAERVTVMSQLTRRALQSSVRPTPPPRLAPPRYEPADAAHLAVLLRAHRRLAARTMAIVLLGVLGLPLLLSALPGLGTATVIGIPAVWLLLGVAVYPLLLALAHWHARRADHVDDALSGPR